MTNNNKFYDFNTAQTSNYNLIPEGNISKVRLHINKGGHNDDTHGWSGGYVTKNHISGAVYLSCEFAVLEGKYKGRKVWSLIGLYSNKNDNKWGKIGRSFIRGVLNSRAGFTDRDNALEAIAARKIESFVDLEGSEFVARIDITKDANGNEQNIIRRAITPEHKQYNQIMGQIVGGDYVGF